MFVATIHRIAVDAENEVTLTLKVPADNLDEVIKLTGVQKLYKVEMTETN